MKTTRIIGGLIVASLAAPAFAHNGDHGFSFVTAIGHWLTSPSHSLFAVIAGLVGLGLVAKFHRKRT